VEIKYDLKSKILGQEVHSYKTLKSTNDLAFDLAEGDAPEGTLVVAEKQSQGKGRLGRSWFSPPKLGIWMSLILRPPLLPSQAPGLSIAASLAVVLTAKELAGLSAFIKWPNDVIVNQRKFCGILTELSAELDKINFVILGVGINVNHTPKDFPKDLRNVATSLRIEKGEQISRVAFLKRFLEKFETIYLQYKKTGLLTFKDECLRHSYLLGKKIKIQLGSEILEGKAENLDDSGALILRTKEGLKTITAGDVSLL
ncbi:MAG: biotin--[acetyl-CoA-carboxylase] ligase, partial [candidate division Zixibacteria bacterium]|nr:biotin--[acetyl-CoA-carboxylase] ligase [candidate division Zixibacteria bacterium]